MENLLILWPLAPSREIKVHGDEAAVQGVDAEAEFFEGGISHGAPRERKSQKALAAAIRRAGF